MEGAKESRMQLEQPSFQFRNKADARPLMPEPLPVHLVAVNDVRLVTAAGLEKDLDAFYVAMLGFERDTDQGAGLAYHAENFRLIFEVVEPPLERDHLRPVLIEVLSLAEAEQKLIDLEIEFTRQRSITPGAESLLLLDPAGNWVELIELRRVM
jgi:hypothetical protein